MQATVVALLIKKQPELPAKYDFFAEDFIRYAQRQGVLALLASQAEFLQSDWPAEISKAILLAQAANQRIEAIRLECLSQVFTKLAEFDSLIFKGASNAFLLYQPSYSRQYADVDLLIREADFVEIKQALTSLGFEFDEIKPSLYGPFQSTAKLSTEKSLDIIIDVHWKINNRLLLADVLTLDELKANSVKLAAYGETAYGAGLQDSLLISCVHDAGSLPHERGRLIGLYDVHLILNEISSEDLLATAKRAQEKRIYRIFISYLQQSAELFGGEEQQKTIQWLEQKIAEVNKEPSAALLKINRRKLEDYWLDWLAIKGWQSKIDYLLRKILHKLK